MKIFFLLIGLMSLSIKSYSTENFQIFCQGNRGKVHLLIERNDSKIRLTYNNLDGKKDFPLYDGVVTLNSLPFIKMAEKELSLIDSKLVFEWNLEQCQKNNEDSYLVECNGEAELIYPLNLKIKSFDFFSSRTQEKTPHFTYEIYKVRLGLDSERMHYMASMPFDPSQCTIINPDRFQTK